MIRSLSSRSLGLTRCASESETVASLSLPRRAGAMRLRIWRLRSWARLSSAASRSSAALPTSAQGSSLNTRGLPRTTCPPLREIGRALDHQVVEGGDHFRVAGQGRVLLFDEVGADALEQPEGVRHAAVSLCGPQVGTGVAQPGRVAQTRERRLVGTGDVDHPLAVDHVAEEPVVLAGHVEHALRDVQVPVGLGVVKSLGRRVTLRGGKHLEATDERVQDAE